MKRFPHPRRALGIAALATTGIASTAAPAWTPVESGTQQQLRSVAWTGSRWLAVGDSGVIRSSPNGMHWVAESSGVTAALTGVSGVDSAAAIVGAAAYPPGHVPGSGMGDEFPSATVLYWRPGLKWTKGVGGGSTSLYSVTARKGETWVGTGNILLMRSTNQGSHWLYRPSSSSDLFASAYSPSLWVAVGYKSVGGVTMIQTSSDTETWSVVPAPAGVQGVLSTVAWHGGLFVAAGSTFGDSGKVLLTSSNGGTWIPRRYGSEKALKGVAAAQGLWVAVGHEGTVTTSSDGVSWSLEASGTSMLLNAVAANATRFVAVGAGGTILVRERDGGDVSVRAAPSRPAARVALTQFPGSLRIRVAGLRAETTLRAAVYAASGRKVSEARGRHGAEGLSVSLRGLAPGVYRVESRGPGLAEATVFALLR